MVWKCNFSWIPSFGSSLGFYAWDECLHHFTLVTPCFFKHPFLSVSPATTLRHQPPFPALIYSAAGPSIFFLEFRLSCAHFFLKILQSLPASHRVQTPLCSLGSMFWALLTFLASFPDKSLRYMLVYSVFPREVYFLPHCPYAALPLLEPFLSLPFNMKSGWGFKDQFPQPTLEYQRRICHSSVFWLLQPRTNAFWLPFFISVTLLLPASLEVAVNTLIAEFMSRSPPPVRDNSTAKLLLGAR